MASQEQVQLVMNYVLAKRRYLVIAYKPGAKMPGVGDLVQEFSAHPIKKLLRIRRLTTKADWDKQFQSPSGSFRAY